MADLPRLNRNDVVAWLSPSIDIDVLIIGAGINGAGTFRELALQGVRCLIVDREDFGAGASSASTRMAHGGLRYLENGEIRLVAEATRERNRLMCNAPHAVRPLRVTIPSFSIASGLFAAVGKLCGAQSPMRSRGLLLLKLGLVIYDFLGQQQRAMGRHRLMFRRDLRCVLPDLHPAIRGAATYYDACVSCPERVAFELIEDGLAANPDCIALNHCALDGADAHGVILRDTLGGNRIIVRPRLIVNAAGAWIDDVNRRLAPGTKLIAGTKGSHLVIDNPALHEALRGRAFSFDDGQGRMCITYPFGGMVLLGSTDLRIDDPDLAVCSEDEIHYLLGAIRLIFPMIEVTREQIRYRFCGVRPLPRSSSRDTVDISRDHSFGWRSPDAALPFPVLSLVGGKWTTFRAFAEQACDRVLRELGANRRCGTANLPIGGGKEFPREPAVRRQWIADLAKTTGLSESRVEVLLDRYGTRARAVAEVCAAAPDRLLTDASSYTEREILFLIIHEMAVSLDDILYRRTTIALSGGLTFALLVHLAVLLAKCVRADHLELLRAIVPRLKRENGIDYTSDLERLQPVRAA